MAAGRNDPTPPSKGRYRTLPGEVPLERATPLPDPPVVHRAPTGPVWPRAVTPLPEAVPQPIEAGDITGRVQELLALQPRPKIELSTLLTLAGLVGTVLVTAILWWADVRDGLRDRPTRMELRDELRPLRDQVRDIERLLDRRLPPAGP